MGCNISPTGNSEEYPPKIRLFRADPSDSGAKTPDASGRLANFLPELVGNPPESAIILAKFAAVLVKIPTNLTKFSTILARFAAISAGILSVIPKFLAAVAGTFMVWLGGVAASPGGDVRLPGKLAGLPRAKDIWVRVHVLGTNGLGDWGDPATILVS